jgi:hypothetical protein
MAFRNNPGPKRNAAWSRLIPNAPPRWDNAACAVITRNGGVVTFTPDEGGHQEDVEISKAICATCPEQPACLSFALSDPKILGVWGGYHFRGPASHRFITRSLRAGQRAASAAASASSLECA